MFKRYKSKAWVRKIIKKNNAIFASVDENIYLHDLDKKALSVLKAIPLFDKVCSKYIEIFAESKMNIEDMSNKIRISEKQLPRVHYMVKSICHKLGIEMPGLYLELNRQPNAYTYGDETASITITSGLLECMEDDEIYAVLAHECGHIACKHVLYHTMGMFICYGTIGGVSLFSNDLAKLLTAPVRLAFSHWMRCSELSADRAATICCESAEPVVETMMRLAGGTTHIDAEINKNEFVQQITDYTELSDESKWNKVMEFAIVSNRAHPLLAIRAREARAWVASDEFRNAIKCIKK